MQPNPPSLSSKLHQLGLSLKQLTIWLKCTYVDKGPVDSVNILGIALMPHLIIIFFLAVTIFIPTYDEKFIEKK
jgi:hypothetical protein